MKEPICPLCKKPFKARSKVRIVATMDFYPSRAFGNYKKTDARIIDKYQLYHPKCAEVTTINPQFQITNDKIKIEQSNDEYILIGFWSGFWILLGIELIILNLIFYGLIALSTGIGTIAYVYFHKNILLKNKIKYLESKHCDFTPLPNEMRTYSPSDYYNGKN